MTLATPSVALNAAERTSPSSAIRRGVPADAAALSAFAARTFVETYAAHHDPIKLQQHARDAFAQPCQADELADPQVIVLLAFRDATLCGFAQLRRSAPPSGVTQRTPIELHRLYVDRPWHGLGVGQELLDRSRAAARITGADALWLKVFEHNARAIAFYRKCGFIDVGSAEFLVCDDSLTDRVMVADLHPIR